MPLVLGRACAGCVNGFAISDVGSSVFETDDFN